MILRAAGHEGRARAPASACGSPLQRRRGARHRISVPVRVPRSLRPGRVHRLTIRGAGGGFSEEALVEELIALLDADLGGGGGASEPTTVRQLARRIHSLRRVPGIYARFDRRPPRLVRRSGDVSYEGRVRLQRPGYAPGAPLTSGPPPFAGAAAATGSACSSAGVSMTDSTDVLRRPSDDTSSLKSCGWVAALSATSIDTRPGLHVAEQRLVEGLHPVVARPRRSPPAACRSPPGS